MPLRQQLGIGRQHCDAAEEGLDAGGLDVRLDVGAARCCSQEMLQPTANSCFDMQLRDFRRFMRQMIESSVLYTSTLLYYDDSDAAVR